jgi:adenylate cyclase
MAHEIERKFLLTNDGWRAGVTQTEQLRDGLIARFGGAKVRIRQASDRAWITVKGPRSGITRAEFEYEIPLADAEEMLRTVCEGPILEKVRHCVPHGGRIWAIDIYQGALAGVTLAEVELQSETEALDVPPWVGREITHDPQFRKQALVERIAMGSR